MPAIFLFLSRVYLKNLCTTHFFLQLYEWSFFFPGLNLFAGLPCLPVSVRVARLPQTPGRNFKPRVNLTEASSAHRQTRSPFLTGKTCSTFNPHYSHDGEKDQLIIDSLILIDSRRLTSEGLILTHRNVCCSRLGGEKNLYVPTEWPFRLLNQCLNHPDLLVKVTRL